MDKYYKKAIHLLKYRLNTKHRRDIKLYLNRCKLNVGERAVIAEKIFKYDEQCTKAVENLGVSINKRKYRGHIYDIINDVMADNNELNMDNEDDMDVEFIRCTADEYFKEDIWIMNPCYTKDIKETIKLYQLNPADTLYVLSKIDKYIKKLRCSMIQSSNINIEDIYDYAIKEIEKLKPEGYPLMCNEELII